ncbi:MAG TPA: bifunctional (p)ppGpp synthetase/guanosine-3',5'-bis(diphosphate) 3'-pyrophosphohydrolase [Anaerolineae bacterium]|nr:bifunctional (p)ppGpp synthetase/guanosine-3',5'-bis(diphosphate) 3'-pyrophosphohydrolase [Anaerolineae bacterium]
MPNEEFLDSPTTLEELIARLPRTYSDEDILLIRNAYALASEAHADVPRASGEPYIIHPLAVAGILAELRLDAKAIAAGLLHDVAEDTSISIAEIGKRFDADVASMVDGVTKLEKISQIGVKPSKEEQEEEAEQAGVSAPARPRREEREAPPPRLRSQRDETLRKLFLAMSKDIRVVLIKLADRLHNVRTLNHLKEHKRRRIARETLEIYAPLANRLGIWQIKWQLEDGAFRWLEPAIYKKIATDLQARRAEREQSIAYVTRIIQNDLQKLGIVAVVEGRPKHIYSIYRKMQRKGIELERVYDTQAVRVMVDEISDCYVVLGAIHGLWRPIPGEFDDYIANPKDNMYRSLHTAVVGPDGHSLEVQIRTYEMHRSAELGIAAHWRYKEQVKRDVEFENKLAWLRGLMIDWQGEVADASEFVDSMQTDFFADRVYVFTPQGDLKDLSAGSTPIDFAYMVHTEVGHRCRGARVNGRLVPLDFRLRNGDIVDIITSKRGGPSRDWMNPSLPYTKTSRARSKIRQWFRKQSREENIQQGLETLNRELKRLNIERSHDSIAKLFGYDKVDDFYAALGFGDINTQQVASKVLDMDRKEKDETPSVEESSFIAAPYTSTEGVTVLGVADLFNRTAMCCNPIPGQEIIGYVTRGRGVTIHRATCPNLAHMIKKDPARIVEVSWGQAAEKTHPVHIRVEAYDRSGLLRDIANLVAGERINMLDARATTGIKGNLAQVEATLQIKDAEQLSRILARIERLPNVTEVRRWHA